MTRRALAAVLLFCASVTLAQNRDVTRTSTANIALTGKYKMEQLLRLSVAEGLLQAEFLPELADSAQPYRLEVEGAGENWVVRKRMLGASSYITINRYDFDAPADDFWSTTLTMRTNYFYVYAQSGDTLSGMNVRLTQSGGTLRLQVSEREKGVQKMIVTATAATIRELQANHPRETRQYLVPLLRRLTGRNIFKPGATDVYRVFDKLQPDETAVDALDDLLMKLEADSFKERQEASKKLGQMGAPMVLAALRRDTTELSAEARNRLDVFLAEHSTGSISDVEASRRDLPFLLDCLDDEDVKVRQAAKSAIEAVVGAAVEFDPSASPEARLKATEALRAKHDKAKAPMVKPVAKPVNKG